jgi:hypothetical protein
MTMPHSARPRRNRVAKKRARLGLPPLVDHSPMIAQSTPGTVGVTSMMIPLTSQTRKLLTKVRLEQQRQDPSTVASDQLFASAVLTTILLQLDAALFPALIQAPSAKAMTEAQAVHKVLARPFVG